MAETVSELERIYTIPLRKAHHGARSKRANRAVRDLRAYLVRHLKSDNIWLAGEVNELLWARGKYTIPSRIRVRATRFSDGVVEVTLPDMEAEGSIREELAERREKAAESPVLTPMGEEFEDEEEMAEEAENPVTDITGIGPATAEKLEKIEVETVGDLATAEPDAVADALGKSVEDVMPWIEQAREMASLPAEDSEE